MGLSDITGVFSRYFVVGFFLPAFVALVALWFFASNAFIPTALTRHSQTTQLLILGAVALIAALALSGLSYYITRIYEGYPLANARKWPLLGRLCRGAIALQARRYDRLLAIREDKSRLPSERGLAAARLDKSYPHKREALLPTRVGNAIRAFEQHSNVRWGLDGVTVWPRIEALLGVDEREPLVDAKISFYVFLNASVGAFVVGVCLAIDKAVNAPGTAWEWALYATPFLAGYVLYRAAIGPAVEWGDSVRASIDLHRLDLYEKLGVRAPTSFSDERQLAVRVNKALLFGHPLLGDDLWCGYEGRAVSDQGTVESGPSPGSRNT
jgi:hypothetical protein